MCPVNASQYEDVTSKLSAAPDKLANLNSKLPLISAYVGTNPALFLFQREIDAILLQIDQSFAEIQKFFSDVWDGIRQPWTFWEHSDKWIDVATQLGEVSAALAETRMPIVKNGRNWEGEAFQSYTDKTALQDDAVRAARDKANEMADIVKQIGDAGLATYIAIAAALLSFFAEEILELLASLTGIGALAGVPAAALSAVKVLGLLGAITLALVYLIPVFVEGFQALKKNEQSADVFLGGEWPTATA